MHRDGSVDEVSLAKLLAWFESAGCQGAVLAGTNGEGPSLSAVEKRDLLRSASSAKGSLKLILGIATPSLNEAEWLCSQAAKNGADAVLLMAPGYFRRADQAGIEDWLKAVLDSSPLPVILYQFPKMAGVEIALDTVCQLADHPNFGGLKDSSGSEENLSAYRDVVPEGKALFVGDELILDKALESGWTGTICGCGNSIPHWLVDYTASPNRTKFELIRPVIKALRSEPQPEGHKGVLAALGVIESSTPRLPLMASDADELLAMLKDRLGMTRENPGF
jgi:dihydrodipicolinate synthase/N-acetylneuraminate lyase